VTAREVDLKRSGFEKEGSNTMKYYVTYCVTHPIYTPTTATGPVEAFTRIELEAGLARGIAKWKARGYTVTITKVACVEELGNTLQKSMI
jgi:hypothetical protein